MRTTVEITENQRADLLKLAAQRGIKGFSALIQEALDKYLAEQASRAGALEAALGLKGSMTEPDAEAFEMRIKKVRENWR